MIATAATNGAVVIWNINNQGSQKQGKGFFTKTIYFYTSNTLIRSSQSLLFLQRESSMITQEL